VLNVRPWLDECLDSLLSQTHKNLEILVVDNGSTDGSRERLQEYAMKHSQVRYIEHPGVGRLGGARNAGMRAARGDYIGFVDSDDYVMPEMFAELSSLAVDTGAELTLCNVTAFFQADNHRVTMIPKNRMTTDRGFQWRDRPHIFRNLTSWNKLYSVRLLKRLDLWFPEGLYHEDQYFVTLAFLAAERIASTPNCHYVYRKQRPGAIGLQRGRDNLHVFEVMRMLADYVRENLPQFTDFSFLSEIALSRYLMLQHMTGGRYHWAFFRQMRKEVRNIDYISDFRLLSASEQREARCAGRMPYVGYLAYCMARKAYGWVRAAYR
jgi:glycosyltransferase involved in cell wall biosynthesis